MELSRLLNPGSHPFLQQRHDDHMSVADADMSPHGLTMKQTLQENLSVDDRWTESFENTWASWTAEKDEHLIALCRSHTHLFSNEWEKIAHKIGTHKATGCRSRYYNLEHLPDQVRETWTEEDDLLLAQLVMKGFNWKTIARKYSNHNALECTSRWHKHLKQHFPPAPRSETCVGNLASSDGLSSDIYKPLLTSSPVTPLATYKPQLRYPKPTTSCPYQNKSHPNLSALATPDHYFQEPDTSGQGLSTTRQHSSNLPPASTSNMQEQHSWEYDPQMQSDWIASRSRQSIRLQFPQHPPALIQDHSIGLQSYQIVPIRTVVQSEDHHAQHFQTRTPTLFMSSPTEASSSITSPPLEVGSFGAPYTPEDDDLISSLYEDNLSWEEIAAHFPGRTATGLRGHYFRAKKQRELIERSLRDNETAQRRFEQVGHIDTHSHYNRP